MGSAPSLRGCIAGGVPTNWTSPEIVLFPRTTGAGAEATEVPAPAGATPSDSRVAGVFPGAQKKSAIASAPRRQSATASIREGLDIAPVASLPAADAPGRDAHRHRGEEQKGKHVARSGAASIDRAQGSKERPADALDGKAHRVHPHHRPEDGSRAFA